VKPDPMAVENLYKIYRMVNVLNRVKNEVAVSLWRANGREASLAFASDKATF